jgi:hypothetical protein
MWVEQTDHFDKQDVVKRAKGVKLQVSAQNRAGRRTGQANGVCMFHEAVQGLIDGHRRRLTYCRVSCGAKAELQTCPKPWIPVVGATETLGRGRGTVRIGQLEGICLHCILYMHGVGCALQFCWDASEWSNIKYITSICRWTRALIRIKFFAANIKGFPLLSGLFS